METSGLAKIPPIDSLQIRPITVISNTLNAFRSIYSLDNSPLVNLILNPLSGELPEKFTADSVVYKAYVSDFIFILRLYLNAFWIRFPLTATSIVSYFRKSSGYTGYEPDVGFESHIQTMHKSKCSQYLSVGRCSWNGKDTNGFQLGTSISLWRQPTETAKNFDLYEK